MAGGTATPAELAVDGHSAAAVAWLLVPQDFLSVRWCLQ